MADFFQNGTITTLHGLNRDGLPRLEAELESLSRSCGIGLVLPALYSEFEQPAIRLILDELRRTRFLRRIVLVLTRANGEQYRHVKRVMHGMPAEVAILWIDSDPVQSFLRSLGEDGLCEGLEGKGRSAWLGLGYLLSQGDCEVLALQDCDIKNYSRRMLARLVYPLVHPEIGMEFAKGFYARCSGQKLHGRVTRLFFTPLLRACQDAGIDSELLRFADSFRYALAGEFAMNRRIAERADVPCDWGLEVGMLAEVHRLAKVDRVCQVDLTDSYDHKHQELSKDDAARGLRRMTREIAVALFRGLCADGCQIDESKLRTLGMRYRRRATEAMDKYRADALLNGIEYDLAKERDNAAVFARSLEEAGYEFLADPNGAVWMPSWSTCSQTLPSIYQRLQAASVIGTEIETNWIAGTAIDRDVLVLPGVSASQWSGAPS